VPMRSPSPNAADPISDLSVGRDAFHPSLPSHSSQVTLPDNHLDTLTGDVIPAVVVALPLGLLELVDVLSQDRPGPAVLATRLERMLAGGDVVAVLAGEPAMAVALVTMRPNVWYDGPVALLDELCVAPGSRGQGVGSALLARVEAIAQQRGAELLEINVDGDHTDARRFYERHGYANSEPGEEQPLLYYYRQLKAPNSAMQMPSRSRIPDRAPTNRSPLRRDRQ
jgi:GNAT superfamily N-acetyltransferase